ncbi:MAG: PKD domain-containing protein, partial [Bacteroidota bacterium]
MLGFTSEIDCNGGTVTFTNTSTNAFGFVWDFGDGTGPNFEENPVHTYANAGTYTVTLDIVYDVSCAEAFSMDVMVEAPQIFAGFEYEITECSGDSAVVQFFDNSTNTLNNTVSWDWTFETAVPATSDEQNPSVTVFMEGPLEVTLTIGTANNCSNTVSETLDIDLVVIEISMDDTIVVCPGESLTLNPNGMQPDLTYSWTPGATLDDPTAESPVATPLETTTYIVTAYSTVGADTCFVTDSVVVFLPEEIDLELDQEPVVVTCGEDVTVTVTANVDVDLEWTSALEGPLGNGTSVTVNPFRADTISVVATDEFGCMATDTIIVIDNGIDFDVEPGFDVTACQGVDTTLTVVNIDDQDTLT